MSVPAALRQRAGSWRAPCGVPARPFRNPHSAIVARAALHLDLFEQPAEERVFSILFGPVYWMPRTMARNASRLARTVARGPCSCTQRLPLGVSTMAESSVWSGTAGPPPPIPTDRA